MSWLLIDDFTEPHTHWIDWAGWLIFDIFFYLENESEVILWGHDHSLEARTWVHREANESLENNQRNSIIETQELQWTQQCRSARETIVIKQQLNKIEESDLLHVRQSLLEYWELKSMELGESKVRCSKHIDFLFGNNNNIKY